jgi:uncharacterized membrane protein
MDWLSPIREILGFIAPFLEDLPIIRVIVGFILVFFLPGFAWTLVFFKGKQINVIERVALSFGLSIAVVTISILVLNKLVGIKITLINSALIIVTATIIPVIIYCINTLINKLISRQRGDTTES